MEEVIKGFFKIFKRDADEELFHTPALVIIDAGRAASRRPNTL